VAVLFLDPVGGLAGDMILAALVDAGAPIDHVREVLSRLPLRNYRLDAAEETRRGFRGMRVHVVAGHEHVHRHLADVLHILDAGKLPDRVRDRAGRVFEALARAEAAVHGMPIEKVHFHEVGAIDSIVDITAVAIALERLDASELFVDRIPLGHGRTSGAHGEFPLPAPAVLELLRGWPVRLGDRDDEQTTPTGAAIAAALARAGRPSAETQLGRTGIGFGARNDPDGLPNMTRALVFTLPPRVNEVSVLEATTDDMNPEWTGALLDRLFAAGALDVYVEAVHMKKNRVGTRVTVIASPSSEDALATLLLTESTTLGVRIRREERREIPRRIEKVATPLGEARVKIALRPDGRETMAPEFDDCRALAEASGKTIREVYAIVEGAFWSSR